MLSYTYCPRCKNPLTINELGYQACQSPECQFVHYENPTPVVAAIVQYGGDNVILAHNKLWPPKWYGLITGFVEKHEVPQDTVIREVKEELGIEATFQAFIGHYMFKRMNQLIMAFHVKGEGEIQLNDEIDDYKLISFEKARYWDTGTGLALRDFLQDQGYFPKIIPFN